MLKVETVWQQYLIAIYLPKFDQSHFPFPFSRGPGKRKGVEACRCQKLISLNFHSLFKSSVTPQALCQIKVSSIKKNIPLGVFYFFHLTPALRESSYRYNTLHFVSIPICPIVVGDFFSAVPWMKSGKVYTIAKNLVLDCKAKNSEQCFFFKFSNCAFTNVFMTVIEFLTNCNTICNTF